MTSWIDEPNKEDDNVLSRIPELMALETALKEAIDSYDVLKKNIYKCMYHAWMERNGHDLHIAPDKLRATLEFEVWFKHWEEYIKPSIFIGTKKP